MDNRGRLMVRIGEDLISLSYEDLEAPFWDYRDYEVIYDIKGEGAAKFIALFGLNGKTHEEATKILRAEFGEYFEEEARFRDICKEHGIEYTFFNWVS